MAKTIRQVMIELLEAETLSAYDLSGALGIPEKDVFDHLEHIARSIGPQKRLVITPAQCKTCGFQFTKRTRVKTPSRCPRCKNESISRPVFSIV